VAQDFYRLGVERLVNTETAGSQVQPKVAGLQGGGYVVVWSYDGTEVLGQVYDARGQRLGGEFTVNTTTVGNQGDPDLAALDTGGFVVTWTDSSATGGDASGAAIKAHLFNADGSRIGSEFLVNTTTSGPQANSDVNGVVGGGFAVAFESPHASGHSILSQLFDASGAKVGAEQVLASSNHGVPDNSYAYQVGKPVVNGMADGGYLVAWLKNFDYPIGEGQDYVAGQFFLPNGEPSNSILPFEFSVGMDVTGFDLVDLASGNLVFTFDPTARIAATDDGGWAVVSQVDGEIVLQRYDAGGNWLSEETVNTITAGLQSNPVISDFGDGGVAVAWLGADGSGTGVRSQLLTPTPQTTTVGTIKSLDTFGAGPAGGGWSSFDAYPRLAADLNADGMADLVAFGTAGTYVSLATGDGQFASPFLAITEFGNNATAGWNSFDRYPRQLADVNGDTFSDIVAFGETTTYVVLGQGDGTFSSVIEANYKFAAAPEAGGWSSFHRYPRLVGDVNGDGRADLVGFGEAGTYITFGRTNGTFKYQPPGFPPGGEDRATAMLATTEFRAGSGAGGGWSSFDEYPRALGDVNGDGRADIVGFAEQGTYVALGQTDGTFAEAFLAIGTFGTSAGGWSSFDEYPRTLGDVNGDGRADIVAFASDGTYYALATEDGHFDAPVKAENAFGASSAAGGWDSFDTYPRAVADFDGDHRVDIVGFANDGTYFNSDLLIA